VEASTWLTARSGERIDRSSDEGDLRRLGGVLQIDDEEAFDEVLDRGEASCAQCTRQLQLVIHEVQLSFAPHEASPRSSTSSNASSLWSKGQLHLVNDQLELPSALGGKRNGH
jgi:hypothetical protein